jgi:hypothetical protein
MPARRPLDVRFWEKVVKSDGCWLWTGGLNSGYGQISVDLRPELAHRVSWILHHGSLDGDLCVLHSCDTPRCVRPDHLFLGTRADNMADCVTKGRNARGERMGSARLSAAKVAEIRRLRDRGALLGSLAQSFGVHPVTIHDIVSGKTWAAA